MQHLRLCKMTNEVTEFVVFNKDGIQTDSIDPVLFYTESDDHFVIDNGFNVYMVEKIAGETYEFRIMGGQQ